MIRFALRFISGKYQGGEFPIHDDREIIIGRSSELDMVLVEDMVSRKHSKITSFGGELTIEDLGSTNGTFVNGERVKFSKLKDGDRVLIGTSIIKLNQVDETAAKKFEERSRSARFRQQTRHPTSSGRPMSGTIEEIPLPDLLQLLSSSRKSGVLAIRSVRTDDDVEIIAHRGASAAAPENTMASIEQAVAEKADWTEIDVQETADDQVVVFHDSDFKKIANVDLKIWDATMDDLESIDIGTWFDPRFKDERVPTLAEVLEYCKGKAKVTIELKYYGHDRELEQRVAHIVEAAGMESDVVIISLKQEGLQKMKQIRPDWETGLLTAVAIGDLTKVDADFLAVNANIATHSFVRLAHERGKKVIVWTVNDPITMSTMIGRGVDGLITDKPALAREVLEMRSSLSTVERMLIELASLLNVKREVVEQ